MLGVPFAEAHGGFGGTRIDVMVVMQELGRGLVVEPYLRRSCWAAVCSNLAGSAAQKEEILPRLVQGKGCAALAHGEPQSRYDLHDVATTARRDGAGYVLNGRKSVVLHGASASTLIVSARTAGGQRDRDGITLFLVDAHARGVRANDYRTIDGLRAADIALEGVNVGGDALLGTVDGGLSPLERVVDHGVAALCAEAVGAIEALNDATLDYLKTREQFGQPIGRFQALQHRAADMLIHKEQVKSIALLASVKVESNDRAERVRARVRSEVAGRARRPRRRKGCSANARWHGRHERAARGALCQATDHDRLLARRQRLAHRTFRRDGVRLNRQILLVSRPTAAVTEANFKLVETPIPTPGDGQFLVRNHWLSLDPYMRGRMDEAKSYAKYVELGEVMEGGTVGEVIESRHAKFPTGQFVTGAFGWQEYALSDGSGVRKVDPKQAPLSYFLGVLGMPGVTAWMGLIDIAQPKAGETVVVSAAAGAVGSVVGQLAKLSGCRAIGIAGGQAKCDYVVGALGFDACVDHKAGRLPEDLAAAAPKGIDVFLRERRWTKSWTRCCAS